MVRRYDPVEYGRAVEDCFMDVVLKQMAELDDLNQISVARVASDPNRKWHRIKSWTQSRKRQHIRLCDAAAIAAALGHDVPGFFLLVAQTAKEKLDASKIKRSHTTPSEHDGSRSSSALLLGDAELH